ncbi:Polyketide synthase 1 [Dissostichus eleginoides]|uniref:Polyketide synthase 1 n=1 Tax=Dissostichus eleginoides TaxID=100907 RepID=A0AAD9F8N6_DISEL|nr:Polyketide synthase 1 [Dissostichus eleginoides]
MDEKKVSSSHCSRPEAHRYSLWLFPRGASVLRCCSRWVQMESLARLRRELLWEFSTSLFAKAYLFTDFQSK